MTVVQSIKPGSTPQERKLIESSSATADPAATEHGRSLNGADWLHLYCDLGAATDASVTPWYWNQITETWHEDAANQVTFTATQTVALIETRGEEKLFLVLDSINGAGTVSIWGGYSYSDADVR